MMNSCAKSALNLLIRKQLYNFGSKPKSYYEVLDVKPTSTQKELRAQFLKKGNWWCKFSKGVASRP